MNGMKVGTNMAQHRLILSLNPAELLGDSI